MKLSRLTQGIIAAVVVALVVVVVGILVAGDGSDDTVDQSGVREASSPLPQGEQERAVGLFTDTCGRCHALTLAGTTADVGPDLDEGKYDAPRVLQAIEEGPGQMTAGLLEGEEAQLVARLIATDEVVLAPPADEP